MKKAILITVLATVIAIGCVVAYFTLHEDNEVDYHLSGYCYTPEIGVFTVTIDSHKDEITEGYWYIDEHDGRPTHLTFVNGVATFTQESIGYSVGILGIPYSTYIEIPGFTCHRVL